MRRLLGRGEEQASTNGYAALAELAAQLGNIEQRLAEVSQGVAELQVRPESNPVPLPALPEAQPEVVAAVTALEKQISRAGREQFKANTLAETQLARLTEALEQLRTADAERMAEIEALRTQQVAAQTAARLDVARAIIPALDGLDEALRAGEQVLAQPLPPPPAPGFWGTLFRPPVSTESPALPLHTAMRSWLQGLDFVRQRLLAVLEREGIRPIYVTGQVFDPELHVVLDVVAADADHPAGTVSSEVRQGYRLGDRILRHAEVVVAK